MFVGIHPLALSTPDLERLAEVARLRAAGVPFLSDPVTHAYGKVCDGRDPDGNLFERIEFEGDGDGTSGAS